MKGIGFLGCVGLYGVIKTRMSRGRWFSILVVDTTARW